MSTIKIYRNEALKPWKLTADKLFKIDDIISYLAQFDPTTISKFQYIHHALEKSIKVVMSQELAQPEYARGIKYVSIQNDSENIVYYYVKNCIIRSQNAVQLDLVMDVLNTFTDGTDYKFKKNTRIIREHKDRITLNESARKITINNGSLLFAPNLNYEVGQSVQLLRNTTLILEGEIESITFDGDDNLTQMIIYFESEKTTDEIETLLRTPPLATFFIDNGLGDGAYAFTTKTYTIVSVGSYWRNIDAVNENINPYLQCGDSNGVKLESASLKNQNWYLLYRNQNDPSDSLVNPVECYLVPEEATPVSNGMIVNGRIYGENLEPNKFYYIPLSVNDFTGNITPVQQTITLPDGTELGAGLNYNNNYALALLQRNSDGTINVYYQNFDLALASISVEQNYTSVPYVVVSIPCPYEVLTYYVKTDDFWIAGTDMFNDDDMSEWDENTTPNYLNAIEDLDRTEAKNIKLIKVPYCPFDFAINQAIDLSSSPEWEYTYFSQASGLDFYALKLRDNNMKLHATYKWSSPTYHPFRNLYLGYDSLNPAITDLRRTALLDSKLFHSEFYKPNYFYDSFSYAIQLEKCDLQKMMLHLNYQHIDIRFDMTSTINSRFMFSFTNYEMRFADQNYAKIMPITRNNEEVLYNVPYINYIRTGYNYDVKAKNLSNVANWTGVGLSVASIGASLLAPSVPLKVAGVVAGLISMATTIKSAITTTIQNEQSLQNKIQQTQNQTASVSGSDDVDLMSVYAENRLKYLVYEPMPNMKALLSELFFYTGYNSGRMAIPTHNNRCNFDYLECDAVFEEVGTNLSRDIIEELKNSFKVGVTYIHKTTRGTDPWDIEQKYENWENSLLEG